MKNALQIIGHNASVRAAQVEPGPMHENYALSVAMQQLEDAAKLCERESAGMQTKFAKGCMVGRASAYRHVISVLAQTKVEANPAAQGAVAGWKLVPIEPTDKMMIMGGFRFAGKVPNSEVFKEVRKGWNDMLSVAPEPPASPPDALPAGVGVDVENLTYRVANAKLGERPSVRCEGPTDFEKDQARAWVKRVLAALSASAAAGEDRS